MEKKNTVLLTVIAVATLLVAVVGATFAYFSASVEGTFTETQLKAAELGITFTGTKEIVNDSIEPGWSDTKEFTVENTSDYDMTFDINWTGTVNNFTATEDLTYSIAASYVASTNDSYTTASTVQMLDKTDTTNYNKVAASTKVAFAVNGTLPTGGSVVYPTATEGNPVVGEPTITPSTDTVKIVRVFIPAHTTEKFVMTVGYTYLDTDQNQDQGKYFRTTVNVTSNGIDPGTLRQSESN